MPSILATPYPLRGQVLIQVNFADVPTATNVCVTATDPVRTRSLHPYLSYSGAGCLALSCGQAIFWDTETACGVNTQYCATVTNAAGTVITTPAAPLVTDTFTRVVANGWGTADTGEVYTVSGGAAADYSVTGTRGQMAITSTAVTRTAFLDAGSPNYTAAVTVIPTVVALTSPMEAAVALRRDDTANNDYRVLLLLNTGGTLTLQLQRNLAGVVTTLASTPLGFGYTATTQIRLLGSVWGSQLQATAWDITTPQPTTPTLTATDTAIVGGNLLRLRGARQAGNTNGTVNMQWDNLSVLDVCAAPVPIQACVTATIACDGCFRLGDPVRPCNDIHVCLCNDGECGAAGGTFFGGISPDTYGANSGNLLPVNAIYPIVTSRNRRAPTGILTVIPTTFTDRDQLLALLQPGGALLWRGPAAYGIGDRYISVGDVPVAPALADLTFQVRGVDLPFAVTDVVTGPSLGVCGSRFTDLCDIYSTWQQITDAGLTGADLILGEASGAGAGLWNWNEVQANNVDWNALQASETDWADVLDGD